MPSEGARCDGCFLECEPRPARRGAPAYPCPEGLRRFAREWRGGGPAPEAEGLVWVGEREEGTDGLGAV